MFEAKTGKGRAERLAKELTAATEEAARAAGAAKTSRDEMIRSIADGVDVEASRKREAAARAAAAEAAGNVEAISEALRQVRAEEEAAARADEVASRTAEARKFAAEADEGLKAGVAKVAAGLVEVGKALVAAADSEEAASTLADLKAPPEGRTRFHALEVQDAIAEALLAAYPSAGGNVGWVEEFKVSLVPFRCSKK